MHKAKFTFDVLGNSVFNGYSTSETWYGWACPLFTYDEALKVVCSWKAKGLFAEYDEENDKFIFENQVPGHGKDRWEFSSTEIGGIKVYPVGAQFWFWEESSN